MVDERRAALWTFPEGAVAHDQSVKGYAVEAPDGHVGEVSWADYKPGESYLVLTYRHHLHLHEVHHVVPAGAVARVDHERRVVTLNVTVDEVRSSPTHEHPKAEIDWSVVHQFERGMLAGGFAWPYTDV